MIRRMGILTLTMFGFAGANNALAHHIDGTVYCDSNLDGIISVGDSPLFNVNLTAYHKETGAIRSQVHCCGAGYEDCSRASGNEYKGCYRRT